METRRSKENNYSYLNMYQYTNIFRLVFLIYLFFIVIPFTCGFEVRKSCLTSTLEIFITSRMLKKLTFSEQRVDDQILTWN